MERDTSAVEHSRNQGTTLLDELLSYFESEAKVLDTQLLSTSFTGSSPANNYQSVIKCFGRPILPPVMTDQRYEEMAMYKRQAMFTETRLKARSRQKLLSRVQSIMDNMNTHPQSAFRSLTTSAKQRTYFTDPTLSPPSKLESESAVESADVSSSCLKNNTTPALKFQEIESSKATADVFGESKITLQEDRHPQINPGAQVKSDVRISPKSETRDSGISSQPPVSGSTPLEVSAAPTESILEEKQDTMAEITDISDEDAPEASVSDPPVNPVTLPSAVQGRTVAERLMAAVKTKKEEVLPLRDKLQVVAQNSARSSANSTTASTASTDDTALEHTVVAKITEPLHSTKTETESSQFDTTTNFEPLSSTRSLLSRVAFNLDDEDDTPGKQLPSQLPQENIEERHAVCSTRLENVRHEREDNGTEVQDLNQPNVMLDKEEEEAHSILTIGPVHTPDVSQIDFADQDSLEVTSNQPTSGQPIPVSDETDEKTDKKDAKLASPPVSQPQAADSTQGAAGVIKDASEGQPDMLEGSGQEDSQSFLELPHGKSVTTSTLYTYSTSLSGYMAAASADGDTIHSSITTLPHLVDEEIEVHDREVVTDEREEDQTPTTPPTARLQEVVSVVPKEKPEGIRLQGAENMENQRSPEEGNVASVNGLGTPSGKSASSTAVSSGPVPSSEAPSSNVNSADSPAAGPKSPLPVPNTSVGSPGKALPSTQERLRRGSYTLDSPSAALLMATGHSNLHEEKPHSDKEPVSPNNQDHSQVEVKSLSMSQQQRKKQSDRPKDNGLTNSMEDLKLKPVQRTLVFDQDSESVTTSRTDTTSQGGGPQLQNIAHNDAPQVPIQAVRDGKQEHLRRYLQTLSQMPQLPPGPPNESIQSSPKSGPPSGSSPGQVYPSSYPHMSESGGLSLNNTSVLPGTMSDDSLSQSLQLEFEAIQLQLLEQQQQQLSELLMQQQRQQLEMQQEFVKYEAMLLESSGMEEPDALLQQQMQEKQRHLLQQQMAMQQQLRWQMQQQQKDLRKQLRQIKRGQETQPLTSLRPVPSAAPGMVRGKKQRRRKVWQEQPVEKGWQVHDQENSPPEPGEVKNEGALYAHDPSAPAPVSSSHFQAPEHAHYLPDIRPLSAAPVAHPTSESDTLTDSTLAAITGINRSGVSVSSNPFDTHRSAVHSNSQHGSKKHVSFSTDIDASAETSSVTSHGTLVGSGHSRPQSSASEASTGYTAGMKSTDSESARAHSHLPKPAIEPLPEVPEGLEVSGGESSLLSSIVSSPGRLALAGGTFFQSPIASSVSSRLSKASRNSPKSPRRVALSGPKISMFDKEIPEGYDKKFAKVSAAAKGYLTRRLMRTDKVQQIIKTITDTAEFAIRFQQESLSRSPGSGYSDQDRVLVERVLAQLTAALYEVHDIFFEIPMADRMGLIAQTRAREQDTMFKLKAAKKASKEKRLSSATLKAIERKKKAKAAEIAAFGSLRPQSCPPATSSPRAEKHPDLSGPLRRNYQFMMSRVLKPIQAHLSPIKPVKDTLNSNPLRSSYDKLYMRALKRAVAMEKKEQREKATKRAPGLINMKNVKPKINTGIHGVKKTTPGSTAAAQAKRPVPGPAHSRPPSTNQAHPWK